MKIKLVVGTKDKKYMEKLIGYLNGRYAEQLEIYSFTDLALLCGFLQKEGADIVLAGEEFKDAAEIKCKAIFGFLTDYRVDDLEGKPAVCKYQKVESIYKQILSLYSELEKKFVSRKANAEGCVLVAFYGASGGVGASTMAVAYAKHQAQKGKKVLYLNLENMASTTAFFHQDGGAAFDDVLFALKSKKLNLALKIESTVRKDGSGVFYFEPCSNCVDMLDLRDEDLKNLLDNIIMDGHYDQVVIDSDFSLDEKMNIICEYADRIVLVGTGNQISNLKMEKFMQSIATLEERNKVKLLSKILIAYNKFRNRDGKVLQIGSLEVIGGAPLLENASPAEIAGHVSKMDYWEKVGV